MQFWIVFFTSLLLIPYFIHPDIYVEQTKDDFINDLRNSGIVGLGGSGFPSFIKYNTDGIKCLLVNAVECEPFISSDKAVIYNYSEEIPKEDRTYEVKMMHTIYTTDNYGVTFGHDISYVITDNSYIALFRSGTNFDNVVGVNYSVSLDDEFNPGVIASGSDEIGEEYKFEFNDESGYGMYVMTRKDGIKNTLGKYYLITLSFDVKDPEDESKTINLTAAYNPRFTDSVAYVKDMDKNN